MGKIGAMKLKNRNEQTVGTVNLNAQSECDCGGAWCKNVDKWWAEMPQDTKEFVRTMLGFIGQMKQGEAYVIAREMRQLYGKEESCLTVTPGQSQPTLSSGTGS